LRWLTTVYNSEMTAFFANVTSVGKFKWELDVAAHRAGRVMAEPEDERPAVQEAPREEPPMDTHQVEESTYQEVRTAWLG
jgi:hypothetical protein